MDTGIALILVAVVNAIAVIVVAYLEYRREHPSWRKQKPNKP